MLPVRYARRWQAASCVLLITVLVAALMPAVWFWDDKRAGLLWFTQVDKWLHGVTFLALTVWFTGLYSRRSYWKIGLGLLLFGFAIEICQRIVGYRSAELLDVGADGAGIVIGLVLGGAGIGGWCLRVENHFTKR